MVISRPEDIWLLRERGGQIIFDRPGVLLLKDTYKADIMSISFLPLEHVIHHEESTDSSILCQQVSFTFLKSLPETWEGMKDKDSRAKNHFSNLVDKGKSWKWSISVSFSLEMEPQCAVHWNTHSDSAMQSTSKMPVDEFALE